MAAAGQPSPLDRWSLDRPIVRGIRLEHVLLGVLLIVAAGLRLLWLGHRPLHHDESIHAYYSWRILTYGPSDYRYDPVYHGPALYYLTAASEWLFGPSDTSARVLPVLTGLGLVALAWPLRTLIGRREALFYAALVTVSPTLSYYSRALRHDVPMAFFTFAALIAFLHFLLSGRRRHAYLAGLAIGMAAATKEDIYLSAFMFANVLWLVGLARVEGASDSLRARAVEWLRSIVTWLGAAWIPLATSVLIALSVALTLYTSLFTHPQEWNATKRALAYWWGQHEKQRIGGSAWYYLPLEIGYEALIFVPALVTFALSLRQGARSRIEALFLFWALLASAVYAWAQEKVPWLLVPVLLPQTVLAASFFARQSAARLAICSPVLALTLWSMVASSYLYDAPRTSEPPDRAHFEPIVYVQTTYDVTDVLAEIESVTRTLGTGKATPMVVVGDATWPLSWYLREYPVHWNSLPKETSAPIVIVDPGEAARLSKDLGDRYRSRRFAVRGWWQIEWDKMTPGTLLRFFVQRRIWNPVGTTDAVMMIAKDLQPNQPLPSVALRAAPPAREYSGDAARPSGRLIGSPGLAAGQFAEPAGLAFDGDGNLLVADSKNHRIQKLSPDGQVLAVWGGPDAGEDGAHFRQPCGVAAAPDGSIYVADTWNHRVVKLDRSGRYLLDWREQDPGFWGPRAVVVAANGSVFVADTGNKRVLAYDPNGRKLFEIGGEGTDPGKLIEPVGLAIDDKAGALYVADTGNHRVQSFDLAGKPRLAWPVFGWQEFYTEPYLAWHAGELWATDSYNHRVNAYGPLGALVRSIDGGSGAPRLGRPTGIAIAADGHIFLSDATENRLAVLDAPPAR